MRASSTRPLLVAVAAAVAAAGLVACGGEGHATADGYRAEAAEACRGATTGTWALSTRGADVVRHVDLALRRATSAVRALNAASPPKALSAAHAEALHSLEGQVARLRNVREQIERGSRPLVVLAAARAGLVAGDRQATQRLAAVGVRRC